jgi:hypothetical protein
MGLSEDAKLNLTYGAVDDDEEKGMKYVLF